MSSDQKIDPASAASPATAMMDPQVIDRHRSAPLHSQIEEALHHLIEQHFSDGDVFFKELEIAERFQVSRPTVRQALGTLTRRGLLNRRPFVGTIVTKPASAPVPAKTKHVGIFASSYDSEMISMLLQQIVEECRHRHFISHTYYISSSKDIDLGHRHALRSPAEERCISLTSAGLLGTLQEAGYRTVYIESPARDFGGLVAETDARMAVQIGVDYLRSLGHEKITLLVNEPDSVLSVQDKIEQFQTAYPAGELVNCGTRLGESSYQAAYNFMPKAWKSRPTAIMTASDPGAWAVLRWLAEQNISVPGEVSVLGFEDARSSQFMRPALSTLAHPLKALASTVLELLWEKEETSRIQLLPPDLIIRDSTGPNLRCR